MYCLNAPQNKLAKVFNVNTDKQRMDSVHIKSNMHSYKLLVRVLNEQCNVSVLDASIPVEVKKSKDVSSDSLQNPSDPDATYSSHKGQGYHVQIMETYTETEDKEVKAETLNLIIHVEVEKAGLGDVQALIPAIESAKSRGLCPKRITVDSLYGSYDNCETAKEMGITVISPVMSNAEKGSINLKNFEFSEDVHLLKCPKGNEPVLKKINDKSFSQCFSFETCSQSTVKEQCIVRRGKRHYYFRY